MSSQQNTPQINSQLRREIGVFGAMMMGLGSIVGTGVFVSIGIAAGIAGPSVILAIGVAALVALCNGMSSAQLAASHPVSGGSYEYGYRYLYPWLGFLAGWLFLCAKSASAATAALGFSAYLLHMLGGSFGLSTTWIAVLTVLLFTIIVLSGVKRTNVVNIVMVSISVSALIAFVFGGLPTALQQGSKHLTPFWPSTVSTGMQASWRGFLEACALMFVAYTGYGRIATLGEEVKEPHRSIPIAIMITLAISMLLYIAVAYVGVASVGASQFRVVSATEAAPLASIAKTFRWPGLAFLIAVGAMTAMLGVLLNLLLGLSRVLLAMGRRADMPQAVTQLNTAQTTPTVAVLVVGVVITALVLLGNVKTTWSFSAFTVLIYYAITNLASLVMPSEQKIYPKFFAWMGLLACLFLAFWVELKIWLTGLLLIGIGLVWHLVSQRLHRRSVTTKPPHP